MSDDETETEPYDPRFPHGRALMLEALREERVYWESKGDDESVAGVDEQIRLLGGTPPVQRAVKATSRAVAGAEKRG